jgi:glutathione S-transferase
MQAPYRLFGAELSPYSVKVRSYLRFKGIAHTWTPRAGAAQEEFAKYAKLPLVPLIVGADDAAMQDSTPIIERIEGVNPDPSITPPDASCAFVSALIEDHANEWLNKAMFHYRWAYEADQLWAAKRIVDMMTEGATVPDRRPIEAAVRERMIWRLGMVGSNSATAPLIERSFRRFADLLEAHLRERPYIFGRRPSLADFGVFGQVYELLSDPTPGGILRAHHPHVVDYVDRMLEPAIQGDWDRDLPALERGQCERRGPSVHDRSRRRALQPGAAEVRRQSARDAPHSVCRGTDARPRRPSGHRGRGSLGGLTLVQVTRPQRHRPPWACGRRRSRSYAGAGFQGRCAPARS